MSELLMNLMRFALIIVGVPAIIGLGVLLLDILENKSRDNFPT